MLKVSLIVAAASVQALPRIVELDGVPVEATVPTLVLELVDPATDEHVYRRIPAPTAEQIAAYAEGTEVVLTLKPKE